ncbi:Ig-like domain-containing protein, partial [Nemorincola caseinilytica]|uniref:Ig-like domain-containing protein n=1 Tax=Nemorincola caseinilytica TaxID=2054315 RepID=UPI0031EC59DB
SSMSSVASVNASGNVTGGIVGNATITYALPTGCLRTQAVVVNPLPASITGTNTVCEGLTTDLNNSTAGGTWTTADGSIATVDGNTGLVTGGAAGVTSIIYTLPTGCSRSRALTVNETPDNIGGTLSACPNGTSQLSSSPNNGTWSSGASSIAGISSTGL